MKKQDLKKILKPIVKECITEVILSEGLLASIISEVMVGMHNHKELLESNQHSTSTAQAPVENSARLQETRNRMLDAIGKDAYKGVNVFEGTVPMSQSAATGGPAANASNPLANVDPKDPGVDISGVFGMMSSKWGKIAKGGE